MKRFGVLLVKELRELLTPQTLIPIFLVVLVFLGFGKLISREVQQSNKAQPVLVIDNDNTATSAALIDVMRHANLDVTLESNSALPAFGPSTSEKAVIVIPAGFTHDLAIGKQATLQTYTIQNGFSVAKLADTSLVSDTVSQINTAVAAERLSKILPKQKPAELLAPVQSDEHLVVGSKVASVDPAEIGSYIGSQTAFVPVILFIVIVFAGQMVATAMANEKENKTLETLLSVPISRTSIVAAKMVAAAIVAGITAGAYIYGLQGIQSSFTGGQSLSASGKAALNQLGLNLSPESYVMLGIVLFLGILVALAIALVLGAFADNIKSVQSLIMPLMVLLLIPYMTTLITDVQTLPTSFKVFLYAIPFTYTFQAMPNLYVHNYTLVLLGAAYELFCFIVFIVIAAKLFSSDQILTLKLPWMKR
jgi:ABC-2 type transport system permease protein